MPHCLSTAICLPFVGKHGRGLASRESQHGTWSSLIHTSRSSTPSHESQYWSSYVSIHVLDDDSLLNIFYLCRPDLLDGDEANDNRVLWGGNWARERWWYQVAQVCRRWRNLLFGSASYLGLCLVCTHGTRVADMLANSPPLPLIIDHAGKAYDITAEDEEGIALALRHHNRVRRIRLQIPVPNLQRLLMIMDQEFPMLEYLFISPRVKHDTGLILPRTFQAPRLRHFILINFAFPINSPLFTTMAGLLTLSLGYIVPSAYFHPGDLLTRLALMPQLETLRVTFHSPVPSHRVERQLLHNPITSQVTLPNLRWLGFGGVSAYLEALLPWMTTPLLERLQIVLSNQLTISVSSLLRFINTTENLRLGCAKLAFNKNRFFLKVYPSEEARMYAISLSVVCNHLDWQVAAAAQILNTLSPSLSAVVNLILSHQEHTSSEEEHNKTEYTHWRDILRSFNNLKTIRVPNGLVKELSRSLQKDEGESSLELLPELESLEYFADGDGHVAFTPFRDARRIAGHPVTLVYHEKRPAQV